MTPVAAADPHELDEQMAGAVFTPADDGWDGARMAWNVAVDQRPAAVALPVDENDIVAAVNYARENGLRIAPQGTGHNARPLGSLAGTILLRTSEMRGVEVDADRGIARVRAGDLWQDVMGPTAAHGMTALAGSAPDVGIVGYSLGGGIGWLARKYGLAANSVTAVELVTADGSRVRTDCDHEPELFWALRGGGGNFGVVTAIEFALYPVAEVYGGALAWDWSESERVPEALGRVGAGRARRDHDLRADSATPAPPGDPRSAPRAPAWRSGRPGARRARRAGEARRGVRAVQRGDRRHAGAGGRDRKPCGQAHQDDGAMGDRRQLPELLRDQDGHTQRLRRRDLQPAAGRAGAGRPAWRPAGEP